MKQSVIAVAVAVLAACGGESNRGAGVPETDTTGTAQSVQQTGTASATTTGVTGGTVSATSGDDKDFVSKAGMAGLAEVQMGNLALQKAQNADVKAYAQRMVTEHSASNAELAQLATVKGLALPTELGGEHKSGLEHLNSLSGAEFDRAFMQHMVADHRSAVSLFESATTTARDADIKAFADKTLPVLREHLAQAEQISGKV
jgi:putative membrane protein